MKTRHYETINLWECPHMNVKWALYNNFHSSLFRVAGPAGEVTDPAFTRKKIGCDGSVDVTKCLQQIEIPDILHRCGHCSQLLSNIITIE